MNNAGVIVERGRFGDLSDENRIMSHFGLKQLNLEPRPGLKGLIDCAGLTLGQITNASVIFGLAPRINAAGRLGDPRRAVDMMIQTDELYAFRIAQELEHDNRKRRAIDEQTFEQAAHRMGGLAKMFDRLTL